MSTPPQLGRAARQRLFWNVFLKALLISLVASGVIGGGLISIGQFRHGKAPRLQRIFDPKGLSTAGGIGAFFVLFSAGLAAFISRPPADSPTTLPEDLAREDELLAWSVRAALLRRFAHLDAINGYLYLTDQRILFRKRRWEVFRKTDFEWARADLERITICAVPIPVHHFKATLHLTSWEEIHFMFRRAELETWLDGLERCGIEVAQPST